MLRRIGIMAMILAMLMFVAGTAMAQLAGTVSNVEQPAGSTGKIDWSTGVVTAVGIGPVQPNAANPSQNRAMALQVARLDAYRKLLEAVKGVQVDSTSTVENFMVSSDVINAKVSGFIQGATVMKTAYQSDGSVEVTIGLKLTGALADALLPKGPMSMPTTTAPTMGAAATAGKVYTGLIVDARGLHIKPAMAPKILNEDGKEVYGSAYINRDWAVREGMVGYLKDPAAAQANPRVKDTPLMVKALKASGQGRVDMVISNADAAAIQNVSENLNMLQKCKVIVLVD